MHKLISQCTNYCFKFDSMPMLYVHIVFLQKINLFLFDYLFSQSSKGMTSVFCQVDPVQEMFRYEVKTISIFCLLPTSIIPSEQEQN